MSNVTHSAEDVRGKLAGKPSGRVSITLAPGDSAWNPASTKRDLRGPAEVEYVFYPDGGVDTDVQPPRSGGQDR